MTSVRAWWRGTRPRTLGIGVAPVAVGTAAAGQTVLWRTAAALLVAVGLQVGVNFANDYFDGVRGVDRPERLGPPRLVGSGAASPRAVLIAALASLSVAAVAGLALALATQPVPILAIGGAALLAAVGYSGGPRPYAGLGLGEVAVFAFFGVMATAGTAYVQAEQVTAAAWWASVPMGLLAVAVLVVNNLRDIPTDEAGGKRTAAVRLGDRRTRMLYRALIVAAFAAIPVGVVVDLAGDGLGLTQWSLLALAAWPLAIRPMEAVGRAGGRELIGVLTGTALLQVAFAALLALGLWIAGATA